MQTTKWGPEGWILLHSVPFYYPIRNPSLSTQARFREFFGVLRELLPCIYCRRSYSDYWDQLDIDPYLKMGRKGLFEWTYHLHNLVNKKLRDQGYLDKRDPSFSSIWKRYTNKLIGADGRVVESAPSFWGPPAWGFISTIAFNYNPERGDDLIRCSGAHARFFELLGTVLKPTGEYRSLLKKLPPALQSREHLTSWLHMFREILNEHLGKAGRKYYPSYKQFHNRYEARRAKCAKKTCRVPVNASQRSADGICHM